MASLSTVVTRGYQPAGSISLVVTAGYGQGALPPTPLVPPEPSSRGGPWPNLSEYYDVNTGTWRRKKRRKLEEIIEERLAKSRRDVGLIEDPPELPEPVAEPLRQVVSKIRDAYKPDLAARGEEIVARAREYAREETAKEIKRRQIEREDEEDEAIVSTILMLLMEE